MIATGMTPAPARPAGRPRGRGRPLKLAWSPLLAFALATAAHAQGTDASGNPTVNGHVVLGAWNPRAGSGIPESPGAYPEDAPNLAGWDYRINLPHVRLQALPEFTSGAAMVGVVEDAGPTARATLQQAQHVNNSIWLFAADGQGRVRFKLLPSRRSYTSATVENVQSLTTGWGVVGLSGTPNFAQTPAALVVGEGVGTARIYVAARATDGALWITSRPLDAPNVTTWNEPWTQVSASASLTPPALGRGPGGRIVVAWQTSGSRIHTRSYDPALNLWGPEQDVAPGFGPRLLWDGQRPHLFFVDHQAEYRLLHARGAGTGTGFETPRRVSTRPNNQSCDVMLHNGRFHAACSRFVERGVVWYAASTTPPSEPSSWSPAQSVGLDHHRDVLIGALGHALYLVARDASDGRLAYVRKDPHSKPFEWTPTLPVPTERWLELDASVDTRQAGRMTPTALLSFNHDLYLTARLETSDTRRPYLVNFGRAALKHLMTSRVGMRLVHGSQQPRPVLDGDAIAQAAGGAFLLADVDHDGDEDLVRPFPSSAGGEVRVAKTDGGGALGASSSWISGFAYPGHTVLAADVSGDGRADLVRARLTSDGFEYTVARSNGGSAFIAGPTVRHHSGALPAGTRFLLGDVSGDRRPDLVAVAGGTTPGRVYVARGSDAGFGSPAVWAGGFVRTGWTVRLGDFNGDGRQDLVVMAHAPVTLDGVLQGAAPVWVALSTGTAFAAPVRWRRDYVRMGQVPLVADFDLDGRADLVSAVHGALAGEASQRVYVAFSSGAAFRRPVVVMSTFAGAGDVVLAGNLSGHTRGGVTGVAGDRAIGVPSLVKVSSGRVYASDLLGGIPFPVGAPFERYRFFTAKGLGVAMFPDRFWNVPCVAAGHRFALLGLAGSGGGSFTQSSVRPGGSEGHILEELGHSVFANCIDGADRLGLRSLIYSNDPAAGGFGIDRSDACTDLATTPRARPELVQRIEARFGAGSSFIDCRDGEHFFLGFLKGFRLHGERIRFMFSDPAVGVRFRRRYTFIRDRWFEGVEYHNDQNPSPGTFAAWGLTCLPGQCPLP